MDGGDPAETNAARKALGFMDGQTTNPTLISKNPEVQARISKGEKFTSDEAYGMYKKVVAEMSGLVDWSVSIETYSDQNTKASEMIEQAHQMYTWISNAWIKLPTTTEGLKAAEVLSKEGMRLNMTLCFSQEQAAAVYAATRGAKKGDIFVSPFVGRLDDRGENGMQLIENILTMYEKGDGHVMTLVASLRNIDHHFESLRLKAPIITLPYKVFHLWEAEEFKIPDATWKYDPGTLKPIEYKELDLNQSWTAFDVRHDLTDSGIARFASDWNALVQ